MNRAAVLQVAGLAAITVAAFMWSLIVGVLVLGVALVVLGIAEEIR